MADPTSATLRESRHYLIWGHVYNPMVKTGSEGNMPNSGDAASTGSPNIGAPLMMKWSDTDRTINGVNYTNSTPGLVRISQNDGGITGYRWLRVVDRPATSDVPTEPLRLTCDGVADGQPSFEINGWVESLQPGGFGGTRIDLTIHDPTSVMSSVFVAGRVVAIYVEEWEDGSIKSASELFCGFVEPGEVEDVTYRPVYSVSASTIERLYMREGMDSNPLLFFDTRFDQARQVIDAFGSPALTAPQTGLTGVDLGTHVIENMHVHKVISHLMQYHMRMEVDGTEYTLAQMCDFRCDYWNLDTETWYFVPMLGIPMGNLMQGIIGMLPSQAPLIAYSFRTSDITVTPDHEFKDVKDTVIDSIDTNYVYGVTLIPGPDHPVGQVLVVQAAQTITTMDEVPITHRYPETRDSRGSIFSPPLPFFIKNPPAAIRTARGIYYRENSRDRIRIHLPGATFGLHNLLTYQGDTYAVEMVTHQVSNDELYPHTTLVLARKLDLDHIVWDPSNANEGVGAASVSSLSTTVATVASPAIQPPPAMLIR